MTSAGANPTGVHMEESLHISLIEPTDEQKWDEFVARHPFGWLTHLSGWRRVIEQSFPHIKGFYLALTGPNNTIRAALPVYEVRSRLTGTRLVSVPFAAICDPLISAPEDLGPLLDAVTGLSRKNGAAFIELRSVLSSPLIHREELASHTFYKHHYLLLSPGLDRLKAGFHRSCVRQRIARGENSGLQLKKGATEADLESLYRLYRLTRKRLGLPPQPYSFFWALWDVFAPSGNLEILLAEHDGRPLAGLLLFKFKDRVSAEYAVMDDSYRDMSPNHYLFWEAIKSASLESYRIFDFGLTPQSNKQLLDFKSRWGTQVIDCFTHYYPKHACTSIKENESSLGYRFVQNLCKIMPDRAFTCFGAFIYKHMG